MIEAEAKIAELKEEVWGLKEEVRELERECSSLENREPEEPEVQYVEIVSGWKLYSGSTDIAFLPKVEWTREQVQTICDIAWFG